MAKKIAMDSRRKPELLTDERYLRRYVKQKHHLRCSRYDWTIEALDATFRPEQVMLVYYEEIFRSAETVQAFLKRVCGFIGLDFDMRFFPRVGEVIWASKPDPITEQAIAMFEPLYWPVREFLEKRIGYVPESWGEWQTQAARRA